MDFEIPNNTLLEDKLKEIAEKQSEAFDDKAIKSLNQEAIMKLFTLCIDELKERGVIQIRWLNLNEYD